MIIGFDIDDTITDTFGIMFGCAQKYTIEELKRDAKVDFSKDYSNHNYIQRMHNWSEEETDDFFSKYYKKIIDETRPFPFAVEIINKLKEEGNKIVLISVRWDFNNYNMRKLTEEWLEANNIKYDKLEIGISDKKKVALENNLDIFVDDSFENCKAVSSCGIKTYIMDSRCNKNLEDSKVERVFSWPNLDHELRKEIK